MRHWLCHTGDFFPPSPFLGDHWAAMTAAVQLLAMQAVQAFIWIDVTFWMNGLNHTFLGAALAGTAAVFIAL